MWTDWCIKNCDKGLHNRRSCSVSVLKTKLNSLGENPFFELLYEENDVKIEFPMKYQNETLNLSIEIENKTCNASNSENNVRLKSNSKTESCLVELPKLDIP